MVQWLRLCTSSAGAAVSIPGWGAKIPHTMWQCQKIQMGIQTPKQWSFWVLEKLVERSWVWDLADFQHTHNRSHQKSWILPYCWLVPGVSVPVSWALGLGGLLHMTDKKVGLKKTQGRAALILGAAQWAIFGTVSPRCVSVFHFTPEPNSN